MERTPPGPLTIAADVIGGRTQGMAVDAPRSPIAQVREIASRGE
jgi:hypothetical protein